MFDPPNTKQDAEKLRYGQWAGNHAGMKYKPDQCAYSIPCGGRSVLFRQCSKANGNGPDNLYCKQHAKMVMPQAQAGKGGES